MWWKHVFILQKLCISFSLPVGIGRVRVSYRWDCMIVMSVRSQRERERGEESEFEMSVIKPALIMICYLQSWEYSESPLCHCWTQPGGHNSFYLWTKQFRRTDWDDKKHKNSGFVLRLWEITTNGFSQDKHLTWQGPMKALEVVSRHQWERPGGRWRCGSEELQTDY